jgi:hypothetical protein
VDNPEGRDSFNVIEAGMINTEIWITKIDVKDVKSLW